MKIYFNLLISIFMLASCSGSSHNDGKTNLYEKENVKRYQVYRYKYNNGTVDTISTIYREPISSYEFYKNGEIKEYTLFIKDPSLKSAERLHKLFYDGRKLIREELYDNSGILTEKTTIKLIDGVKTKTSYDAQDVKKSKELIYTDAQGRDTCSIYYAENGKVGYKQNQLFDEFGLKEHVWDDQVYMVSIKSVRINNDAQKKIYEEYEDGVLTSKTTEIYEGDKLIELRQIVGDEEFHDKYFYYDNGLNKEQISYSKDGTPIYYTKWFYTKW